MQTDITGTPDVTAQIDRAMTSATPAGFGRRAGALVLDWILLFFLVPGIAMLVAMSDEALSLSNSLSNVIFVTLAVTLVVGAFTVSYLQGATPGMLALSTRVADSTTGKRIGLVRAFTRAAIAFLLVASWFWVFNVFIFSDARLDGLTTGEAGLDYGAFAVFLVGVVGRLWMFIDQHGQTLFDRILRIQVVDKPARADS